MISDTGTVSGRVLLHRALRRFGSGGEQRRRSSVRWALVAGVLPLLIFAAAGCGPLESPAPAPYEASAGDTVDGSFRRVVLDSAVTRPNVLEVAPDGRVFFIEREGALKVYRPAIDSTLMAGFLPVDAVHTSGLLGLALDPGFATNGLLYLYFSPHHEEENVLARFRIEDNRLLPESRTDLLTVPVDRNVSGGHTGGDLEFGPDGRLYLSTGDNTSPFASSGYAPLDEREGRAIFDAQRSSGNSFDLRGKILRIDPRREGDYEIPAGNLYPWGIRGRSEIYVQGTRNPFRMGLDPRTGDLYWGEVGPDAGAPQENRGPAGYDEFNRARDAGHFGWPFFIGPNTPYHRYDFAADSSGPAFDSDRPVNDSPNNDGARVLPPAREAMIWYPYEASERWPELGSGGRTAIAGPVYRYDRGEAAPPALPPQFDGSLFVGEFMRGWLKTVQPPGSPADSVRIQPFLPEVIFHRPFDLEIGPDGALYLIEWGESYEGWYNEEARISRLAFRRADSEQVTSENDLEAAAEGSALGPRSSLRFEWPVRGGIVDLDRSIPYRVSPAGSSSETIRVRALLGHDAHTHRADQAAGENGSVRVRPDRSHLYLEDRYVLLQVCSGHTCAEVEDERSAPAWIRARHLHLQPRRLEAEHADSVRAIGRTHVGEGSGNPLRWRRDVQTYVEVEDGSRLAYHPINLQQIDSIRVRLRAHARAELRLRVLPEEDARRTSKAEIGTIRVDAPSEAPLWRTRTIEVSELEGPRRLVLTAAGGEEGTLAEVDWIEFVGPGMHRPRR